MSYWTERTARGWRVVRADGRTVKRFTGKGAKVRARRMAAQLRKDARSPRLF